MHWSSCAFLCRPFSCRYRVTPDAFWDIAQQAYDARIDDLQVLGRQAQRAAVRLVIPEGIGFNSWEDLDQIKKSGLPIENLIALTPTSLQKESFYDEIEKMGVDIAYGTYQTLDVKKFETVGDIYSQYFKKFDIITTDRAKNVYQLLRNQE